MYKMSGRRVDIFSIGLMYVFSTCIKKGIQLLLQHKYAFLIWCFYAIINLKIVNFYKPWSNMKILMLFHDIDVICLLFHDFDVIGSVIPWFWRDRSVNHVISVTNHIYHGSYSWTYLNQLILRIRWFK